MTESNIMMELIKERPLVFFDLEATGVNILNDRIVEISVVKIFPDGRREVKTRRINPEISSSIWRTAIWEDTISPSSTSPC